MRISPESPEQRAKRGEGRGGRARAHFDRHLAKVKPGGHAFEVARRVAVGVYSEGFIHAGNLAYLALVSLFPFFIVAAAIGSLLGQDADTVRTLASFLRTLPPSVAILLEKPILDVIAARTGSLLWLGALVGLWTVGSFIETIRDVFRRAYGTESTSAFWKYRLGSVLVIVGSVVLALASFAVLGVLTAVEQFVYRLIPFAAGVGGWIGWSKLISGTVMFGALYMLFYSVTPSKYRYSRTAPKWPGALLTTLWWLGATAGLPWALSWIGGYDLTYGSLAGVIVALLFFFLIGLGITTAAQLNAALAETDVPAVEAGTGNDAAAPTAA